MTAVLAAAASACWASELRRAAVLSRFAAAAAADGLAAPSLASPLSSSSAAAPFSASLASSSAVEAVVAAASAANAASVVAGVASVPRSMLLRGVAEHCAVGLACGLAVLGSVAAFERGALAELKALAADAKAQTPAQSPQHRQPQSTAQAVREADGAATEAGRGRKMADRRNPCGKAD